MMPDDYHPLSREDAENILQNHLGTSKLLAGNIVYLNRYRARPLDVEELNQAEEVDPEVLRRYLALKELRGRRNLDTHYGQLSHYAWLKGKHATGAGYSPLNHGLSRILELYPEEAKRLESISRRLAFLEFLRREMKYMNEKYDYDEIPLIFEFYTNKVEVFTTLLVDLLMVLAEFWCDQPGPSVKPGSRPKGFQDLFETLSPLESRGYPFFKSINIMLELSAAIAARHKYVHGIGPTITQTNTGGLIEFEIPVKQRYGAFEMYMRMDLYKSLATEPPAESTAKAYNPRFPQFQFELRRAKKGQFHYRGSKVRYVGQVTEYVDMLNHLLWMVGRAVTSTVLDT